MGRKFKPSNLNASRTSLDVGLPNAGKQIAFTRARANASGFCCQGFSGRFPKFDML